jgi:hypothetical protein
MKQPQTIVGKIDRLLDDHCAVDEIAVLLGLQIDEVDRIARLLREVGPPDPDPLPAADVQDAAEQVAALDEPGEGWPRIGTSPVIDRGQALRQVQAATVVIRRATSGTDLEDLAGALGIRHAVEVAERAMLPGAVEAVDDRGHGDDTCRCVEITPATLQQPAEWEQADDCPVHPRAVVDPAADRRCTRQPGCPWGGDVECGGCNGDEAARRARYDADERPAFHEQPDPAPAADVEFDPTDASTYPCATGGDCGCAGTGLLTCPGGDEDRAGVARLARGEAADRALDAHLDTLKGAFRQMDQVAEVVADDARKAFRRAARAIAREIQHPSRSTVVTEANANDWPPPSHVHDPFAVADQRGVWHAECE